jgi:hypothetical protein
LREVAFGHQYGTATAGKKLGKPRFQANEPEIHVESGFVTSVVRECSSICPHKLFEIEKEWRWSGTHYQRIAEDWLANFDAHRDKIEAILRDASGDNTLVVDATLALVLPRHRGTVRFRRRQRMGRQPLADEGGARSASPCSPNGTRLTIR